MYFYYSLSGLTRHQSSCTAQGNQIQDDQAHREMSFSCPTCQKPFSQKRYLTQHLGSKRCVKRKEFLERTASFSIAPSGGSTAEDIPLETVSVKSCYSNDLIPYLSVLWRLETLTHLLRHNLSQYSKLPNSGPHLFSKISNFIIWDFKFQFQVSISSFNFNVQY